MYVWSGPAWWAYCVAELLENLSRKWVQISPKEWSSFFFEKRNVLGELCCIVLPLEVWVFHAWATWRVKSAWRISYWYVKFLLTTVIPPGLYSPSPGALCYTQIPVEPLQSGNPPQHVCAQIPCVALSVVWQWHNAAPRGMGPLPGDHWACTYVQVCSDIYYETTSCIYLYIGLLGGLVGRAPAWHAKACRF